MSFAGRRRTARSAEGVVAVAFKRRVFRLQQLAGRGGRALLLRARFAARRLHAATYCITQPFDVPMTKLLNFSV